MIGQTLSHYKITAALGAGGMGEVYRATDTNLSREVAIKLLPAEVAEDAERLVRFKREAHLLAALNHPNIAAIYGLEEADGKPFLALELVEGEDLKERLGRGAIPVDEALEIAKQIAEALEEAHNHGIIPGRQAFSRQGPRRRDPGDATPHRDQLDVAAGIGRELSPTAHPGGRPCAGHG